MIQKMRQNIRGEMEKYCDQERVRKRVTRHSMHIAQSCYCLGPSTVHGPISYVMRRKRKTGQPLRARKEEELSQAITSYVTTVSLRRAHAKNLWLRNIRRLARARLSHPALL